MSDGREEESPLITRCPHCETSFRVTEAHLQAANGAVRCGACLLVFPASEHMVDPHGDEDRPASSPDPELTFQVLELEDTDTAHEYADDEEHEVGTEQVWGEGVAGEMTADVALQEDPGEDEFDLDKSGHGEEYEADVLDEHGLAPGFSDDIDVQSAPDEIIGPAQRHRSGSPIMWTVGSLVLVSALGLQYAWMHKGSLSLDTRYRSYYVTSCAYLGCQIPDYRDNSALHTASVTVRSHTEVDQALVFNALLRNDAPFRQRFPPLDLQFTDMQGDTVAARRFEPREYLGGEMAGLKYIPSRTEVRISLEVVDPGQNALGYSLTVPKNW